MVKLGIISDEVSDDFERSCEHIRGWGLSATELRSLWGKNILELSPDEVGRARAILAKYDLTVTAIASPIFKSPLGDHTQKVDADFALSDAASFDAQLDLLEHACKLCQPFGTRTVRVFSFWRETWTDEQVSRISAKLLQAAEVARHHDAILVVENEPVCNVRYGWEMAELFTTIKAQASAVLLEHLAVLWDPGNALYAGEARPYPDGYKALAGHRVAHVHLKDVAFSEDGTPRCVPLGWGELDFIGQLQALLKDGYAGPWVLEPHYRPEGTAREAAASTAVGAARTVLKALVEIGKQS